MSLPIHHRFKGRTVNPETKTLIIGTFNPETPQNKADFFYGRPQNHLWRLLPVAFGESSLKKASIEAKYAFIAEHRIDFLDLIDTVAVEPGEEANYSDNYLDSRVMQWRDVIGLMDSLPELQRVGFTRKTFSGIPNIKAKVDKVEHYCAKRGLGFKRLLSPSRIYSAAKQKEWSEFLSVGK